MNSSDLKKYLKENGIDTKNISIRHSYFGYSDGFNVTIKDININRKKVEHLLNKFESIDRDERTGEILAGGNTYIDVYYDYESIQEKLEEYNSKILDYISNLLDKEPEEIKRGYLNGSLCLRLSDNVLCFKENNLTKIRDEKEWNTRSCDEKGLTQALLNMGVLEEVMKKITALDNDFDVLDESIKLWYLKKYPSDELGNDLSDNTTFQDLSDCLEKGKNVYELLGGDADSVIRERCFTRLAELTNQDYESVYQKWLSVNNENCEIGVF